LDCRFTGLTFEGKTSTISLNSAGLDIYGVRNPRNGRRSYWIYGAGLSSTNLNATFKDVNQVEPDVKVKDRSSGGQIFGGWYWKAAEKFRLGARLGLLLMNEVKLKGQFTGHYTTLDYQPPLLLFELSMGYYF
jgi:hypothetical protein